MTDEGRDGDRAAWLATILDHLPTAVSVWDEQFHNLHRNFASHVVLTRLGFAPTPERLQDGLGAQMFRNTMPQVQDAFAGRRQRFVAPARQANGSEDYFDCLYLPFAGVPGLPKAVVTVGTEVKSHQIAGVLDRGVEPLLDAIEQSERRWQQLHLRLAYELSSLVPRLDAARAAADAPELVRVGVAVRESISALRAWAGLAGPDGFSRALEDEADLAAPRLGSRPRVVLRGRTDRMGDALEADVREVVRHCLADIAGRGAARTVVVAVIVNRHDVTVTVVDDARRASSNGARPTLLASAERRGGACGARPNGVGGTVVVWRVPVDDAPRPSSTDATPGAPPRLSTIVAPGEEGRPKLQLDAAQLQRLLDTLPVMVSVHDNDTRCVYANEAQLHWIRRSLPEAVGDSVSQLLPADAVVGLSDAVRGVLQGIPQQYERATVTGDGRTRHVRALLVPWVMDGRQHGFVSEVVDVTDEVESQDLLRRRMERLSSAEERKRDIGSVHESLLDRLTVALADVQAARRSAVDPAPLDRFARGLAAVVEQLRSAQRGAEPTPRLIG